MTIVDVDVGGADDVNVAVYAVVGVAADVAVVVCARTRGEASPWPMPRSELSETGMEKV